MESIHLKSIHFISRTVYVVYWFVYPKLCEPISFDELLKELESRVDWESHKSLSFAPYFD
jgi:hypothetical protein